MDSQRKTLPEYKLAALHFMSNSSSAVIFLPSSREDVNDIGAVPAACHSKFNTFVKHIIRI